MENETKKTGILIHFVGGSARPFAAVLFSLTLYLFSSSEGLIEKSEAQWALFFIVLSLPLLVSLNFILEYSKFCHSIAWKIIRVGVIVTAGMLSGLGIVCLVGVFSHYAALYLMSSMVLTLVLLFVIVLLANQEYEMGRHRSSDEE